MSKDIIKKIISTAIFYATPSYYQELKARRARAHSEKLEHKWGCHSLSRKVIRKQGPVVKRGPFSGVEFIEQTFHRHITPKLIGSYESELHNIWITILSLEYSKIINIGSAEGYYSVGLASHFKHTDVIAFDTDPWARRMTRLMAERNGVSNLTIRGTCTEEWLNSHLDQGAFILSDCEGCEENLMNPVDIPSLCFCDILIELHESASPGVTERIKNRFSDSHHLTLIGRRKVQPENYPELRDLSPAEKNLAVSELRFCEDQKWLYCIAK